MSRQRKANPPKISNPKAFYRARMRQLQKESEQRRKKASNKRKK